MVRSYAARIEAHLEREGLLEGLWMVPAICCWFMGLAMVLC